MTKFLHRPMFRTGGSAGQGITSGLTRPGYHRGRVVNPGGYDGTIDWKEVIKGYPEAKKIRDKELGEYPKGTSGADFWLNFGTNILAQPGGRPILQTLGTAAQDPLKQLQQQKAMERHGKREEDKHFLDTYMATQADILSGESAASIFKDEKIANLGKQTLKDMWELNEKFDPNWTEDDPAYKDWLKEKALVDNDFNNFEQESGIDMKDILGGAQGILNLQEGFASALKKSDKIMKHPETGEEIEEADFYNDPSNRGYLQEKIIDMTIIYIDKRKDKRRGWKSLNAEGGRAGYQGGELVEQEDVNIQTPRGDISMQETVEEGVEPDQLSYEELRSRLPVEITDDIVRLLVSSASALGDFAQIQTQVDVDNFNAKYGVNLVLPSEA